MNVVDGIQMITNMVVFGIIRVHILNRPFHRIYQTRRNECRPATMEEIVQCTVQVMEIDGVAKGNTNSISLLAQKKKKMPILLIL